MSATYVRLPTPAVPPEQHGNVVYGTFMHLGSPFCFVLGLAWLGVTLPHVFMVFFGVSVVFTALTLLCERYDASIVLPTPTRAEVVDGLFMVFVKGIAVGGAFVTLGWWALSHVPLWKGLGASWWGIAAATVGTDLAYYLIHRFLSHGIRGRIVRYYRRKHAAHHAVTALDFLRGNQSSWVDTAFSQFQPSLIVLSWLLGLDLAGTWAAYLLVLALQATDHTSVTYNIGWLRYLFMDNHAHKFHHCIRGNLVNHAAAFSIFDRAFGTFYEDWSLSSNYLHQHRIPLPIKALASDVET